MDCPTLLSVLATDPPRKCSATSATTAMRARSSAYSTRLAPTSSLRFQVARIGLITCITSETMFTVSLPSSCLENEQRWSQTFGDQFGLLMDWPTLLSVLATDPPRKCRATSATTAMRARSNAYSTRLAPSSSLRFQVVRIGPIARSTRVKMFTVPPLFDSNLDPTIGDLPLDRHRSGGPKVTLCSQNVGRRAYRD